jgi:hypothetical protein
LKNRIELITLTDVKEFVDAAMSIDGDVYLVDNKRKYRVSAKSIIGVLLSQSEWASTYVESEVDCYNTFSKWIV